jgi:adenine-specific DNA-methyltransferase
MTHIQRHLSEDAYSDEYIDVFSLLQRNLNEGKWVLSIHKEIINRTENVDFTLADCCYIGEGFKTGLNKAFIVDEETIRKFKLEIKILVPLLRNSHISRYYVNHKGLYLIYTTNKTDINQYKHVKKYLERFRESLENRFQFKDGTCKWYSLSIPQSRELFDNASEKIFCPYRAGKNTFAYDNAMHYGLTDTYIIVPKENCEMNIKYLLALLNSRVLNFWYNHAGKAKGSMNEYFTTPLSKIPIRKIDFSNPEDASLHNNLIELVNQMISLSKAEPSSINAERGIVKLQIEIDRIVYRLYNALTKEDIHIIEKE